MSYKVCVITGTRAEFGLLIPLLEKLNGENELNLQLVVTGSHLMTDFGNTYAEIEKTGIPVYAKMAIDRVGDTKADMAVSVGDAIIKFARYFEKDRPDLLVVLGDRFEIFAAVSAASLQGIPIAHIHGGETTEGAVDEFLRHSITKMSYLHFTACEEYRQRVIQLGEDPSRVFNVGALGVENIVNLPAMSLKELSDSLAFNLTDAPFSVVTMHPVTQENNTSEQQVRALIEAMEHFHGMNYIITKANADAGGRQINEIWDTEAKKHDNWKVIASLGAKRYLSALKYAKMMLGNSSSGIIEAPVLHVPTVNIGDRQKGRMMASSVICCDSSSKEIVEAMTLALSDDFQRVAADTVCPFGDGHTSNKIIHHMLNYLYHSNHSSIKKSFFDVQFEVKYE